MAKAKKKAPKKAPVAPWAKDLPKLLKEFDKLVDQMDTLSDKFEDLTSVNYDDDGSGTPQHAAVCAMHRFVQCAKYAMSNSQEAINDLGLEGISDEPLPLPESDDDEDGDPDNQ